MGSFALEMTSGKPPSSLTTNTFRLIHIIMFIIYFLILNHRSFSLEVCCFRPMKHVESHLFPDFSTIGN